MNFFISTGNKNKLTEFKKIFPSSVNVFGIKEAECFTNLQYQEPLEDSNYFLANGFVKLLSSLQFINNYKNFDRIIVDDSGLCVPDLNFRPGVHSATYSGILKNDKANRIKLIEEIKLSSKAVIYKNEKRLKSFFVTFLFEFIQNNENKSISFAEKYSAINFVNNNVINNEEDLLKRIYSLNNNSFIKETMPFSLFNKSLSNDNYVNVYIGVCFGEVSTVEKYSDEEQIFGYDSMFYPTNDKDNSFASISIEKKNEQSHRAFAVLGLKNNLNLNYKL